MPLTRERIDSLIGGISTQPPHIRFPNQFEDAKNIQFSVVDGAKKRPGSVFIKALGGEQSSEKYGLHPIYRDPVEQYLVMYRGSMGGSDDAVLRVFETDGSEATVTVSDEAQAYLNSQQTSAEEFRFVTVADFTVVVNPNVQIETLDQSLGFTVARTHKSSCVLKSYLPAPYSYHKALTGTTACGPAGFYQFLLANSEKGFSRFSSQLDEQTVDQTGGGTASGTWRNIFGFWSDSNKNPMGVSVRVQRQALSGTGLTYDAATKRLTKVGAFTNFTPTGANEDWIALNGGSVITSSGFLGSGGPPEYPVSGEQSVRPEASTPDSGYFQIASKIDNDTIELADGYPPQTGGSDIEDIEYDGISQVFEAEFTYDANEHEDLFDVALALQTSFRATTPADSTRKADVLLNYLLEPGVTSGQLQFVSPWRGTGTKILTVGPHSDTNNLDLTGTDTIGSGGDTATVKRPFHPDNIVYADGTGSYTTGTDDFVEIDDRWKTVGPPNGAGGEVDPTTMPIQMVRTSTSPLTFDVDTITWKARETGDEDTNPAPKMWRESHRVADVAFAQNRLWMISDKEQLVASQAGDFFNYFIEDASQVAASDPIEVALTSDQVTAGDFLVTHEKALRIFTKAARQFEVDLSDSIDATMPLPVPPTTRYRTISVRPVAIGQHLYYLGEDQRRTIVWEQFFDPDLQSQQARDAAKHVEGLLPTGTRNLRTDGDNDVLMVVPDGGNVLYLCQFYRIGIEKLAEAWTRYVFPDSYVIKDVAILQGVAYMLYDTGSGAFRLDRFAMGPQNPDSGMPFTVHMDRQHILTGTYDPGTGLTTWTMPLSDAAVILTIIKGPDFADPGEAIAINSRIGTDITAEGDFTDGEVYMGRVIEAELTLTRPYARGRDGKPDIGSKTTVQYLRVAHQDSGTYIVRASSTNRADRDRTFEVDAGTLDARGTLMAMLRGDAERTTWMLFNNSARPSAWTGLTWGLELAPTAQRD